jgi:hypothetical protein
MVSTNHIVNKEKIMEHHFVVYFDEITKTWHVDTETTDSKFDGNNVWNSARSNWFEWNDNTSEALNKLIEILENK